SSAWDANGWRPRSRPAMWRSSAWPICPRPWRRRRRRRGRATWGSLRRPARASTCSRTMRPGGGRSAPRWRRCDDGGRGARRGPLTNQRPRIVRSFGSDPWLVLAVGALVSLGTVMVFNVSYFPGGDDFGDPLHFFRKHLVSIAIGLVLCGLTTRLGSERYRAIAYPLLAVAVLAMVVVLIPGIGVTRSGARRWLALGGITFQPSELAKFALVLYLARSLAKRGERVRELWHGVIPHCLVVGLIALLCLREPDFGTAALSGVILVLMLFAAGGRLADPAPFAAAAPPALRPPP